MTIEEFLKETMHESYGIRPKIICADGFIMSVQASEFHYCAPRHSMLEKYRELEVGFPSEVEELLLKYAEEEDKPTDTVYGYLPIDTIAKVITKHGGIDEIKTFGV